MICQNLETDVSIPHSILISSKQGKLSVKVADNDPFVADYQVDMGAMKVIKVIFFDSGELLDFQLKNATGIELDTELLYPF